MFEYRIQNEAITSYIDPLHHNGLLKPGNCQQFVFLEAKLFAVELLKQSSTIDLLCMWTYDINKSKPTKETNIKQCQKNMTTEKLWKWNNRCCVAVCDHCVCVNSVIHYCYHRVSQYQHHCDLSSLHITSIPLNFILHSFR